MNIISLPEELLTHIFCMLNRFYSPIINSTHPHFKQANIMKQRKSLYVLGGVINPMFPIGLVDYYRKYVTYAKYDDLLLDIYSRDIDRCNKYNIGFVQRRNRLLDGELLLPVDILIIIKNVFSRNCLVLNEWLQKNLLINWGQGLNGFDNHKVSLLMLEFGDIDGLEWLWERGYIFSQSGYLITIKSNDIKRFKWLVYKGINVDPYSFVNAVIYRCDDIFYYLIDKCMLVSGHRVFVNALEDISIPFYWMIVTIIKERRLYILEYVNNRVRINTVLDTIDKESLTYNIDNYCGLEDNQFIKRIREICL